MENSEPRPSNVIFITSLKLSNIILDKGQMSLGATLEVLLFSSAYVLVNFKAQRPLLYNEFEEDLIAEIKDFCIQNKMIDQLPCTFDEFLDNRLHLYRDQLTSMTESRSTPFMPSKLIYNFYENPLAIKSGVIFDMQQALALLVKLKNVIEVLDKTLNMIVEIYYSFNPINTKNPGKTNPNHKIDPKLCFALAYKYYEENKLDKARLALSVLLDMEPRNINAALFYIEISLKDEDVILTRNRILDIKDLLRTNQIVLDNKQIVRFNDLCSQYLLVDKTFWKDGEFEKY